MRGIAPAISEQKRPQMPNACGPKLPEKVNTAHFCFWEPICRIAHRQKYLIRAMKTPSPPQPGHLRTKYHFFVEFNKINLYNKYYKQQATYYV
jgi:hypothetical protein